MVKKTFENSVGREAKGSLSGEFHGPGQGYKTVGFNPRKAGLFLESVDGSRQNPTLTVEPIQNPTLDV